MFYHMKDDKESIFSTTTHCNFEPKNLGESLPKIIYSYLTYMTNELVRSYCKKLMF